MITRILVFLALAVTAFADLAIQLKDGRIIPAQALRRDKDQIIATILTRPDDQSSKGDFGFKLSDIFTLQFDRPEALDLAPHLITAGKAQEALNRLDPVINYYSNFRDAPGSWWVDAVPLQVQALLALRKDDEAVAAAEQFARLAVDPDIKRYTKAFTAVAFTRKGDHETALPFYDEAAKSTDRREVLGLIAVNRGESLLALGNALKAKGEVEPAAVLYEGALLSFLRIPALYPSQQMFMPQATFGAANAYFGIDDFARARTAIKELKEQFPDTPEAKAADELAEKVDKREKQLADPEKVKELAKQPAA